MDADTLELFNSMKRLLDTHKELIDGQNERITLQGVAIIRLQNRLDFHAAAVNEMTIERAVKP